MSARGAKHDFEQAVDAPTGAVLRAGVGAQVCAVVPSGDCAANSVGALDLDAFSDTGVNAALHIAHVIGPGVTSFHATVSDDAASHLNGSQYLTIDPDISWPNDPGRQSGSARCDPRQQPVRDSGRSRAAVWAASYELRSTSAEL